MELNEREIVVQRTHRQFDLIKYISAKLLKELKPDEIPIRFVITRTHNKDFFCEVGILSGKNIHPFLLQESIFRFNKRKIENTEQFNTVLIIPTGIGAEIGGHSGDGNTIARLISASCDNLITHPNVVNASDINEMTENTLYVEGSIITRLLMGEIGLQKVRSNKILMLMDKHEDQLFNNEIINSVSSARITLGINCEVLRLDNTIKSISKYSSSGRAVGKIEYLERLFNMIMQYNGNYDAIGLSTFIDVPDHFHREYFKNKDMINPWGGIEAMITHSISMAFNIPCAHSPMMVSREIMDLEVGVVDPRKAPETASVTYLHSVLKGLHKSPKIVNKDKGINVEHISCLIQPYGCLGLPTLAALEQEIPVIAVKENKNRMENRLEELPFAEGKLFIVENYLEAVGVMNAIKMGISIDTVRRPIEYTKLLNLNGQELNSFEYTYDKEVPKEKSQKSRKPSN